MLLAQFGPISSGSPKGQGPFFSVLFILVGAWVLFGTWRDYLKRQEAGSFPPAHILGITALAVFFVISGIWGLVR